MRKYENINKTSENRLKPRSYYIPKGISEYTLLNGIWDFAFFEDNYDIPEKVEKWDKIKVPSCWQLEGYENPNYCNINYPFRWILLLFLIKILAEFIGVLLKSRKFGVNFILCLRV